MLVCAQWLDPDHELFDPSFALPYQAGVRRKAALWALAWVLAAAALFYLRHWIFGAVALLGVLVCVKSALDEHGRLQAIRAAARRREARAA